MSTPRVSIILGQLWARDLCVDTICNVLIKVTDFFKFYATCEALLKFLSNFSKFMCPQLHFVTAQLAIPHNYIKFHAQTESVARSTKKYFPKGIQNAQPKKKRCAQGYSVTPSKCLSSQNRGTVAVTPPTNVRR